MGILDNIEDESYDNSIEMNVDINSVDLFDETFNNDPITFEKPKISKYLYPAAGIVLGVFSVTAAAGLAISFIGYRIHKNIQMLRKHM
jgi:hypothetical protein